MDLAEQQRIDEGLRALGLTPDDFNTIQRQPTYETACQALDALKERVRKSFKKLVFELHPDRTGNDPVKTELFKTVTRIREDVEKLRINPPPPPMVPFPGMGIPVVIIQYHGVGRPPQGHPAANGGVRNWPGSDATTTVTMWPAGVHVVRGPRR